MLSPDGELSELAQIIASNENVLLTANAMGRAQPALFLTPSRLVLTQHRIVWLKGDKLSTLFGGGPSVEEIDPAEVVELAIIVRRFGSHLRLRIISGKMYEFILLRGKDSKSNSEMTQAWYDALLSMTPQRIEGSLQYDTFPLISGRLGRLMILGLILGLALTIGAFLISGAALTSYVLILPAFVFLLAVVLWEMRRGT